MTVGRYESAGVVQTIDLGGIGMAASSSFILVNGSFFIRGPTGQYYAMSWANIGDPAAAQGRTELVRYDSPNWHGFIYSASIAEAGDYWGSMLRYAGEFSGIRIAAGIGYERSRDRATPATLDRGGRSFVGPSPDITSWGGGLSLMHVPSGLFVQGHYGVTDFNAPGHVANGYWGSLHGTATADQEGHLALVDPGRYLQELVWHRQHGSLRRVRRGDSDWGAEAAGRNFAGNSAGCPGTNAVCSSACKTSPRSTA